MVFMAVCYGAVSFPWLCVRVSGADIANWPAASRMADKSCNVSQWHATVTSHFTYPARKAVPTSVFTRPTCLSQPRNFGIDVIEEWNTEGAESTRFRRALVKAVMNGKSRLWLWRLLQRRATIPTSHSISFGFRKRQGIGSVAKNPLASQGLFC